MTERAPHRLVVFDFDGTIADTWRDIATALNRTLRQVGLAPVQGPEVRFWIGDGALKLLQRAVPGDDLTDRRLEELFEIFRVHYDQCCLDTTEVYPGILECLDALEGATLAVASNKPTRFLDRVLEGLGLKGRFQVILGGDTLEVRKPDPAIVKHLVEQTGADLTQLWFVGDSAIDIQTGRDAGARTIGCAWGLRGRDELRRARCDFLVEDPRQIPPIVLGSQG